MKRNNQINLIFVLSLFTFLLLLSTFNCSFAKEKAEDKNVEKNSVTVEKNSVTVERNSVEENLISPECSNTGQLICPSGYEPSCKEEEDSVKSEPRCFFYIDKQVPCCMKFAGVKKIDLGLEKLMLGPTSMVKVIGGGETYTLNREAIFCKKIED